MNCRTCAPQALFSIAWEFLWLQPQTNKINCCKFFSPGCSFLKGGKNAPRASSSKQTRSHILKLYSKVVTKILILIKNGICRTISEM